ncbi:Hypothetical predicted protein, partial [Pelobates cultripes]
MKVLYQNGVSLRTTFLFITCCSVWHIARTLFLMPNTFFPYPLPEGYSYGLKCKKNKASKPTTISNGEEDLGIKTEEGQLSINSTLLLETKAVSFISCVRSSLFWFHFIWLSVMQLRHYMFIATLNPTLTRLSGGDPLTVSHYTNVFAVSQFCGILCAPWNGIIIDRFKGKYKDSTADLHSCVVSLAITATQCMLFSISATLSILPAFYATFILQVLNRSFLYGGNAAFLSIA